MRVIHAVAMVALLTTTGCRGGQRGTSDARLDGATVEDLIETGARLRGLPFKNKVRFDILHEQAANETIQDVGARLALDGKPPAATAHDSAQADLVEEMNRLQDAMGLLEPDYSAGAESAAMMKDQLYGWYDPQTKRMYVLDKKEHGAVKGMNPQMAAIVFRSTIVHEAVHAVQDQHFDLLKLLGGNRVLDVNIAQRALVEGDASLIALDSLRIPQGLPRIPGEGTVRELIALGEARVTVEMNGISQGLQDVLKNSYNDGSVFVAALRRVGGDALVNHAFRHPPTSAAQILHPEKYVRGEVPDDIAPLPVEKLVARGFHVTTEDRAGELFCDAYVGDAARQTCVGWRGDRFATMVRPPSRRPGLVWVTSWETEDDAARFAAAVDQRAELTCLSMVRCDTGVPIVVERKDTRVIVMRNLPPDVSDELIPALSSLTITRKAPSPVAGFTWKALAPSDDFVDLITRSRRTPPTLAAGTIAFPSVGLTFAGMGSAWKPEPRPPSPYVQFLKNSGGSVVGLLISPASPFVDPLAWSKIFSSSLAQGARASITESVEVKPGVFLHRLTSKSGPSWSLIVMLSHGFSIAVVLVEDAKDPAARGGKLHEAFRGVRVSSTEGVTP